MLTNAAATIYNQRRNDALARYEYHKAVVPAVNWSPVRGVSMNTGGITMSLQTASDEVAVFIPMASQVQGKTYTTPKAYAAASQEAAAALWTLDEGHGYIIKGNLVDAPSVATEAQMKAILKATDDACQIQQVATLDMGSAGMRHWEVVGK